MGLPVLILGESGSGKSASLRGFEPGEVGIFNVAGKPLPFRKNLEKLDGATYDKIIRSLRRNSRNCYVIDDSQYLLCFELFDRAKEAGYGKFTDMAQQFYNLLQTVIRGTTPDTIVYFLHHTEVIEGRTKAKTIGRMLDEKLTVEGLFSVVLLCQTDGNRHWFTTQSDGTTTAKSPIDLFEREIDNDVKMVDDAIRSYWGLRPRKNTTKQEDEQ